MIIDFWQVVATCWTNSFWSFSSVSFSAVPEHTKSGRVLNLKHTLPLSPSHTYTPTQKHTHIQSSAMPRGPDQPAAHSDKPCFSTSDPWGCALWALTFDLPFIDLGTRGHLFSKQPGDAFLPSQEPHPRAPFTGKPERKTEHKHPFLNIYWDQDISCCNFFYIFIVKMLPNLVAEVCTLLNWIETPLDFIVALSCKSQSVWLICT